MSQLLTLVIVLGLVNYRISRFIVLDTIIEGWRDVFHSWLLSKPRWWRVKLQYLLGCPFCVGIYVAGMLTWITDYYTSVPLPGWTMLGSTAVALVVWEYIDSEEKSQKPSAKK